MSAGMMAFLAAGLVGFLSACQPVVKDQICFQDQCFNVEVVDREETRSRGLQFRESLPKNSGMLFVFPQAQAHSFWMKDTHIPLDMIWIDSSRRVVHIELNVPPCQADPCPAYTPAQPALYVLELNAGTAREIGLRTGDALEFRLAKFLR